MVSPREQWDAVLMTERSLPSSPSDDESGLRKPPFRAFASTGKHCRWPSLFGRATVLASEEQRLGRVLAALHRVNGHDPARAAAGTTLEAVGLRPMLCLVLAEHFAAEENDGYYGVFAANAPWLVRKIESLKEEHLTLLKLLAQLVRLASERAAANDLPWQAMRLTAMLQAHERKESLLLREFLLGDAP
jgi:hypothetical protein